MKNKKLLTIPNTPKCASKFGKHEFGQPIFSIDKRLMKCGKIVELNEKGEEMHPRHRRINDDFVRLRKCKFCEACEAEHIKLGWVPIFTTSYFRKYAKKPELIG
jgi:hypothetical protein